MKVIATEKGFYDKIRQEGDEFEIKDKSALGSWMKEVKVKKATKEVKAATEEADKN